MVLEDKPKGEAAVTLEEVAAQLADAQPAVKVRLTKACKEGSRYAH
jgi:hypothetical protein